MEQQQQHCRRSARLLAAAEAAAPLQAPLMALSPELQRRIASYLTASEAVHGVALAATAGRPAFLAGVVSGLSIRCASDKRRPKTQEAEDALAASLARLLGRMPGLTWIGFGLLMLGRDLLPRIVGQAIRRLEAPLGHLREISIAGGFRPSAPDTRPHPLAQAMAEGRLPALEVLKTSWGGWDFLSKAVDSELLVQALQRGQLSRLSVVWMKTAPVLNALLRGFVVMPPSLQQRQAPMESLVIHEIEEGWGEALDEEAAAAALRLPCFAQLRHLAFDWQMFEAVAGYLREHEGGRPSLRSVEIYVSYEDEADVALVTGALGAGGGGGGGGGGAPNLESLNICGPGEGVLEAVGAAYAAGGLAGVEKLSFGELWVDGDGARTLVEAVEATAHKGAALQTIEITGDTEDYELYSELMEGARAFQGVLEAARARGVLPNAKLAVAIECHAERKAKRDAFMAMLEKSNAEAEQFLKKLEKKKKKEEGQAEDEDDSEDEDDEGADSDDDD